MKVTTSAATPKITNRTLITIIIVLVSLLDDDTNRYSKGVMVDVIV